jgi:hypothetical protein
MFGSTRVQHNSDLLIDTLSRLKRVRADPPVPTVLQKHLARSEQHAFARGTRSVRSTLQRRSGELALILG